MSYITLANYYFLLHDMQTNNIFIRAFSFLQGFYFSIIFATILGQKEQWFFFTAALLVSFIEILNNIVYKRINTLFSKTKPTIIIILNYFKLGLLYSLFIDAFKLGS